MNAKDSKFENCIFYIDKDSGIAFRYDTQTVAGKFCLPSSEALEEIAEKSGKEVV